MRKPLRILLLADDQTDAELVACGLERAGLDIVSQRVESREAFVQALRDFAPDAVLASPSPEPFTAVEAMKELRNGRPIAPLIVVSEALDEHVVASLRAGVEDVVLKKNIARLADTVTKAIESRRRLARLSPRQLEVLRLIAEGRTTSEIARQLDLSAKTVETHRGEIARRLGIRTLVALVRYAVRVGLVPAED